MNGELADNLNPPMEFVVFQSTAILAILAATLVPSQSGQAGAVEYVDGGGPSVVFFLPPADRDSAEPEAVEARAMALSAMDAVQRCLGETFATFRLVYADAIVVRRSTGDEKFELGDAARLGGGLLYRPGAHAQVLFAAGGPAALTRLVRPAARRYFGRSCADR